MYLYYASWGLFRLEKQKAENSGEAEQWRSREAKKQKSNQVEKQRSRERKKNRNAEKQRSRETETPQKNAQNGKKNKKTWSSFLICTQSERWTATISYSYYNILITSIEGYVFLRLHSPFIAGPFSGKAWQGCPWLSFPPPLLQEVPAHSMVPKACQSSTEPWFMEVFISFLGWKDY